MLSEKFKRLESFPNRVGGWLYFRLTPQTIARVIEVLGEKEEVYKRARIFFPYANSPEDLKQITKNLEDLIGEVASKRYQENKSKASIVPPKSREMIESFFYAEVKGKIPHAIEGTNLYFSELEKSFFVAVKTDVDGLIAARYEEEADGWRLRNIVVTQRYELEHGITTLHEGVALFQIPTFLRKPKPPYTQFSYDLVAPFSIQPQNHSKKLI